jgi:hypothetical protein
MDPSVIKDMTSRSPELKCLRCDGELEEGYLPTGLHELTWRDGKPRLFSLFRPELKHFRVKGFRCVNCGRLELFANPEN